MKTKEEIQRAHDVFWDMVVSGVVDLTSSETAKAIRAQLAVLCWMLGHRAGCLFQDNLDALNKLQHVRQNSPAKHEVVN